MNLIRGNETLFVGRSPRFLMDPIADRWIDDAVCQILRLSKVAHRDQRLCHTGGDGIEKGIAAVPGKPYKRGVAIGSEPVLQEPICLSLHLDCREARSHSVEAAAQV